MLTRQQRQGRTRRFPQAKTRQQRQGRTRRFPQAKILTGLLRRGWPAEAPTRASARVATQPRPRRMATHRTSDARSVAPAQRTHANAYGPKTETCFRVGDTTVLGLCFRGVNKTELLGAHRAACFRERDWYTQTITCKPETKQTTVNSASGNTPGAGARVVALLAAFG